MSPVQNVKDVPVLSLGLSIAKKAAEVHNGHVWVISDEQEGTTFFLSILGSKGEVIDGT
jgi:signal transduction histidine kinase